MRYMKKDFCDAMRIHMDYNGMMRDVIGEHGLSEAELSDFDLSFAVSAMESKRQAMAWRNLPYTDEAIIRDIKDTAAYVRQNFKAFVVLGIGGSALGPIAVHTALCHPFYNEIPGNIRFYVLDNVDPERMAALFDIINPEDTMFNVITKSGKTSETMSQLLIVCDMLKRKLGDSFGRNIIATTDREKGNLIRLAREYNFKTFYIPQGVGGRFSELSPVGLLPAAVCGIDISEMLSGAAYMDGLCSCTDVRENIAYTSAVLQVAAMRKGVNIHVFMPYSDRLRFFSDWYAQLLGESLGKRFNLSGDEVRLGQTPVKALGVTDQHSQIQLYTEGPYDKYITFVGVDRFGRDMPIPTLFEDIPDVAFLGGHTQGELISAERYATEYAVKKSGHMSNRIMLPEANAFTVGELIYMLEMQIAFAGELLKIDAFNQPGVEEGKNATYALLGKSGYDEKRRELESAAPSHTKYVI